MDIDWNLLDKYLAGECTADERARFEAWLAEAPLHRQVLQEMRELAVQADRNVAPAREAALLAALKRKLPDAGSEIGSGSASGTGAPPLRLVPRAVRRVRWVVVGRAAAVVALLAGGAAAYLTRSASTAPHPAAALATRVVSTPSGRRALFDLPDGTHVMLGVASRLEYPADFSSSRDRERDVRLEGEAYFDVVHDERHPFVVRAGDLVATDLGTQFVVRAYRDDAEPHVVVRQGKVDLRAARGGAAPAPAHDAQVLAPGQLGRLAPGGGVVVERVDPSEHFAWMDGRLVFHATPLGAAMRQIERWHDVEIRLATPELAARGFTTSFGAGESARDMLQVIATILHLDIVQTGRTSFTLRAQ